MKEPLNPSQQAAVTHRGSHLLIVAGPGTGKTHTLARRILSILSELKPEEKILAITFTNKAAAELLARVSQKYAGDDKIFVGTFHQFALSLIKRYALKNGLAEGWQIADSDRSFEIAKCLWPDSPVRELKQRLNYISHWKSQEYMREPPAEVKLFNKDLRRKNLLDYDDILVYAVRLLMSDRDALMYAQSTYRYIFVDEYQDVNTIQNHLLKLLAGKEGHVTAIGDPNQAIYGFRGSDVTCFDRFENDFGVTKQMILPDHYRSAANLLAASSQIMRPSDTTFVPALTAKIYSEGHLMIHTLGTEKGEAEYVVHQIEKLVGGTSMFSQDSGRVDADDAAEVSFGDIAVLYRLNSQAHVLKTAFARSGIPFQISGNTEDPEDDVCPERWQEIKTKAEHVSLLSIHAAKGLEFSVVFVVGCEEQILPLNLGSLTAELAEERRLFYVAMTRAKQYLYLLNARERFLYGQRMRNPSSRFLADIQEDLKKYEQISSRRPRKRVQDDQLRLF